MSKLSDLVAILENFFPTIAFKKGLRNPLKTNQAAIEEVSPNRASQGNLYESKFFNILSRNDLKTFDSRKSTIEFTTVTTSFTGVNNYYEDNALISSTAVTTTIIVDHKAKSEVQFVCTKESECSIKADASTILTAPFRIDTAGDEYRYVSRYIAPTHLVGASSSNNTTLSITPVESVTIPLRFSIYDDEHAPVDDNGETNDNPNYSTTINYTFIAGVAKNAEIFNNVVAQKILLYYVPYTQYITFKLTAMFTGSALTMNFTPGNFTAVYTPDKKYESKCNLTFLQDEIHALTFTADQACTLLVDGDAVSVAVGSNTITLPSDMTNVLSVASPFQSNFTNLSAKRVLTEPPYYVQIIESRTQGNLYNYLIEARYI